MKTAITFILMFGILVIIHEFGHFFFARRSGILVREFAIGMGPKLFSHQDSKGTTYTIRLLPVGGYVRMAGWGEDDNNIPPGTTMTLLLDENNIVKKINLSKKIVLEQGLPFEVDSVDLENELFIKGYINGDESQLVKYLVDHDAILIGEDDTQIRIAPIDVQMQSVSVPKRMMTNFAGPMNNFILAILLFVFIAFLQGGSPINDTNQLGEVTKGSVAAKSGLRENDYIEEIAGKKVANWTEMKEAMNQYLGEEIEIKVRRGEKTFVKKLIPKTSTINGEKVGVIGVKQPMDRHFFSGIILGGFKIAWSKSTGILKAIADLFKGFSLNKLGGPVMMFQMSQKASKSGFINIIILTAVLSINLGFVNLLPIPALDGGKIVLNVIEGIRGKSMSREKEGIFTLVGASFLLLLMIAVTWNDILRFFR
ncbi:MAG: RIP metalloprotease RseP [Lactobacillales bacterium]|jgi:regulator of sigma E protease|nr:RIP metalloprotease RseP [Lactobacillales bacterium]